MTKPSYILGTVLGFCILEIALMVWIDRPVALLCHGLHEHYPVFMKWMNTVSDLGKSIWYLAPLGLALILITLLLRMSLLSPSQKQRLTNLGAIFWRSFFLIALSGLMTDLIKILFGRSRPHELFINDTYGFQPFILKASWHSFPSGHATTAFALGYLATFYFPKRRYVFLLLSQLLAFSRVIVTAHFISDVMAAFAVLCLTLILMQKLDEVSWMQSLRMTLIGGLPPRRE